MIADDDPIAVELLREALADRGMMWFGAADGLAALGPVGPRRSRS